MRGFMGQDEMESWEQHDGFNFTKGQKLMKIVSADKSAPDRDMVYGRSANRVALSLMSRAQPLEKHIPRLHNASDLTVNHRHCAGTMLYNVHDDPKQDHPLGAESVEIEKQMIRQLISLMRDVDAPPEQ